MRCVIVGILLFIAFSQTSRAVDKDAVFEVRKANATLTKLLEEKKHKEGLELALKTLRQGEEKLGKGHRFTLSAGYYLASFYERLERYQEAEQILKPRPEHAEKRYGPTDSVTLSAIENLAFFYMRRKRHEEALPFVEKLLEGRTQISGNTPSSDIFKSMGALATCYEWLKRLDDAEALYERRMTLADQKLAIAHPDRLRSVLDLASFYYRQRDYYYRQKDFSRAEQLYERALQYHEQSLGSSDPQTKYIVEILGGIYYQRGNYTKAETLFRTTFRQGES